MTRTIRLDLQYVGTAYGGWQLQPGQPTVQGALEEALERLFHLPIRVHGSGRTDAGVHAAGQVAHFEIDRDLPCERIQSALNHFLPWDIRVLRVEDAAPEFHARSSALSKEYRYRIHRGETMSPFCHPFALHVSGPLELEPMRRAAAALVGRHDFAAFRSTGSSAETTVRTVSISEWEEDGPELIYRIAADGFLYKMVRTIVGTLLEVGRGERSEAELGALMQDPERSRGGKVAPAQGLHLWRVHYAGDSQDCNRRAVCGWPSDVV